MLPVFWVADNRNRHCRAMRLVEAHLAQSRASLLQIRAINHDQIKFVFFELPPCIGGVQTYARGYTKALNGGANTLGEFAIAGQDKGFGLHPLAFASEW